MRGHANPGGDAGTGREIMTTLAARLRLLDADVLGIALAGLLGLGLVLVAGFASAEAMHGAAHDQRHATGFPCH